MKSLLQFVAVALVAVFVPVTISLPAAAQTEPDCSIVGNGANSDNDCDIKDSYRCTIDNNNKITIVNTEDQTSVSGNAGVVGNGTGSDAVTGSASNNSNVTFNVVIENGADENERLCTVASVVPVPPTPEPETPETPETPVQPTQKAMPKALPVTSGSSAPVVMTSLGGLAVVAGIIVAYRRLHI